MKSQGLLKPYTVHNDFSSASSRSRDGELDSHGEEDSEVEIGQTGGGDGVKENDSVEQGHVDDDEKDTSSECDEDSQENDREEDDTSKRSSQAGSPMAKKLSLLSKPSIGFFTSKTLNRKSEAATNSKPKARIKLTLKLPTKKTAPFLSTTTTALKKMKLPMNKSGNPSCDDDKDSDNESDDKTNEVQAMVVDSDEAGEDEAVATALPEDSRSGFELSVNAPKEMPSSSAAGTERTCSGNSIVKASSPTSSPKVSATLSKRRIFHPSKQIRIPPIPSPGLLIPPPTAGSQGNLKNQQSSKLNSAGHCAPSELFDNAMNASGYTLEKRTQHPHRGSSVTRRVDDMFDSNVKFALHFPEIVPKTLLDHKKLSTVKSEAVEEFPTKKNKVDYSRESDSQPELSGCACMDGAINSLQKSSLLLPNRLIQCMERVSVKKSSVVNLSNADKKFVSGKPASGRKRPRIFCDMVPVSLTLPYPEDYIQRRMEYVDAVMAREKAIISWQEAQECREVSREEQKIVSETNLSITENVHLKPFTIDHEPIPPIPEQPKPPTIQEMRDFETANKYKHDRHPLYLPNERDDLVAHLDKNCFHITEGRYFGLLSNFVVDPMFVGANAPGISSVGLSGSSGLATATSGSGNNSGGTSSILGSAYHSAALSSGSANTKSTNINVSAVSSSQDSRKNFNNPVTNKNGHALKKKTSSSIVSSGKGKSGTKKLASETSNKKPSNEPKPTSSSSDLRKIMEGGGSKAESFRVCIIRAAVQASRLGQQGLPFVGPDGETYPDACKAFAVHAGIKPCQRCKSNKQGVYHCRLRRKHEERDYDGGNSVSVLAPLFKAPVDSLG